MSAVAQLPDLLDVAGVAAYFNVSAAVIGREVRRGALPFARVGRQLRFTPDHLVQYTARGGPPKPRAAAHAHIYVIGPKSSPCRPLKIGVATSVASRLKTLQVGNPLELEIKRAYRVDSRDMAIRVERYLHSALAPQNVRGEWFEVDVIIVTGLVEAKLARLCS